MDGIERFLALLEDGKWHSVDEVSSRLVWNRSRTLRLAVFLSEHGLVHYRSSDESVMLDPEFLSLLRETWRRNRSVLSRLPGEDGIDGCPSPLDST